MHFEFGHPWLLILLGVIPVVWVALRYSLRDFQRSQQLLMAATRTVLIVLLVLAASQIRWRYASDRTTHAFLVDVSGSISSESLKRAHDFVNQAWHQRGHEQVYLVTFASSAQWLNFSPTSRNVPDFAPATGAAAAATDLAGALQLAASLMPNDAARQMTILSDGNETRGSAVDELAHLRAQGIKINALPFGRQLDSETAIASVNLPSHTNVKETFNLNTTISATKGGIGSLRVLRNGEFLTTKPVDLKVGDNSVSVPVQAEEAGLTTFQLELKTNNDTVIENNVAQVATVAEGKPRVLYIEGQGESARYLTGALRREQLEVDQKSGLPNDLNTIGQYDLVVVSDTKAANLGTAQMAQLEKYVNDLGGGVVLAGGDGSFGIGGFNDTPVERISPVSFRPEQKQLPSLALILVMDKSGSMAGRKIEMAKDAAVAAVDALNEDDLVGVLEFDHTWEWLAQPRPAREREQLRQQVSSMQASGGTNIYAALEEAYNTLQKLQARTKHVVLMTDGRSQAGDYQNLIEKMSTEKMTVTTIGIGSGADRELLDNIAHWGNGRSYFTETGEELPQIFVRETKHKEQPKTLVEKPFRAIVQKSAEVINGIDFNSSPTLLGYNETKPKPTAETLLVSPKGDPILARWRYGLGKVTAFTSDVKNRWAVNWLGWPGYEKFWTQVARDTMRRGSHDGVNLTLTEKNQQAAVTVELTNGGEATNGQVSAKVLGPDGRLDSLTLRQASMGVFHGEFPLEQPGSYLVTVTRPQASGSTAQASAAIALSPSTEYARLTPNQPLLERLTSQTGGKLNPTAEELFQPSGARIYALRDIWQWLLWAALPLFLVDIFLRRVRLFEPI